MKSILAAVFVLGIFFLNDKENKEIPEVVFCHPADEFAEFTNDDEFLNAHYIPEEIDYSLHGGKMIQFDVEGGEKANAFVILTNEPSDKWVFIIHEWWGLNKHVKNEAERYFHSVSGCNIMAIDLYDGKVATDRETASEYMKSCSVDRAESIINAAYTFVGENAKVGSLGWCFGGGWSLQTAILGGEQAKASVIYYGMPEKDASKLKNLNADVLGIFAAKEKWITPEIVEEFEKNMKLLNKNLTVKNYDADHAFANPSRPAYVKEYADEAFMLSTKFLKERL